MSASADRVAPRCRWLGRQPYKPTLDAQRAHRAALIAGEAQDEIWLLEHDSVITVGRRPVPALPSAEFLAAAGIALHRAERGGLATWHGPGQLVAYVLFDLRPWRVGVKLLVDALEQGVIDWLAARDVRAARRPGFPGVWVGHDKICAIGLHVRAGCTMHGIALNLRPDLRPYGLFTPCGVTDGGVTSLLALRGTSPTPKDAAHDLASALIAALESRSEAGFRCS